MIIKSSHVLHKFFAKLFGTAFSKEGFITYASSIQWTSISKLFTMIFSLVTTMVTARLLGPSLFGTLNYILSISGLFSVLASLGVSAVVYRELVARKEEREEILGSALLLTICTGIFTICLVTLSLFFINESLYIKSLIFLMSLSFITQPLTLLSIDFLKDNDSRYVTLAQLLGFFISNTLKIITVYFFHSVLIFIVILVLENLLIGSIYLYQMRIIKMRTIKFKVSKKQIFFIFTSALPVTFMLAFSEIYARIDQIMLKHYIDTTAVGFYAAATRLTEIWYLVPNILITALFPALVNASVTSEHEYKKRFKTLSVALLVVSCIISVIVALTSETIISIVYGQKFLQAAPLLSIYIFSLIGSFVSLLILQEFFLKKKNFLVVLFPACTAVMNIILNIYLIPTHGAAGAAFATVISYNLTPVMFYIIKNTNFYK